MLKSLTKWTLSDLSSFLTSRFSPLYTYFFHISSNIRKFLIPDKRAHCQNSPISGWHSHFQTVVTLKWLSLMIHSSSYTPTHTWEANKKRAHQSCWKLRRPLAAPVTGFPVCWCPRVQHPASGQPPPLMLLLHLHTQPVYVWKHRPFFHDTDTPIEMNTTRDAVKLFLSSLSPIRQNSLPRTNTHTRPHRNQNKRTPGRSKNCPKTD